MGSYNYRQIKAIESKNRDRLLCINPDLNDGSGIYFFLRQDEHGFRYAYIGQAKHILQRCCGHLTGYKQHIDLSIRKHGLYKITNPSGWRLAFLNFEISELDEMEKKYIKLYADNGYQLLNVSIGGQGVARDGGQIAERKSAKGYYDGLEQGKINMARDLKHIIDLHLDVCIKPEKANNKISQRQYQRFLELLNSKGREKDGT